MKLKTIIHQLTFAAVGGIQTSFIPLYKMFIKKSRYKHRIYGTHKIDDFYKEIQIYYINFSKSIISMFEFIYFLYSKKYIIHFYNNLASRRIFFLLSFFPSSNIIFHERGASWNAKKKDLKIIKKNAKMSNAIIANSNASKLLLKQRFDVDEKKIKVIHNGFISKDFVYDSSDRFSKKFSVGYIGRLDTPKGVHLIIESAKILSKYNFYIAGDGVLEKNLKKMANGFNNIKFLGRQNSINFISKMDVIVVPSIREPLGNVIIEAGFCKKPVIASNIDGIPEIINDGVNGILLKPKNKITIKNLPNNAVPIPDFVVDPNTKELVGAKEINKNELIESINKLEESKKLRNKLGNQLYNTVKLNFTIERYFDQIHKIYNTF